MSLIPFAGSHRKPRRVPPKPEPSVVTRHHSRPCPYEDVPCWVLDARRALNKALRKKGPNAVKLTAEDISAVAIHLGRSIPEITEACFAPSGERLKKAYRRNAA